MNLVRSCVWFEVRHCCDQPSWRCVLEQYIALVIPSPAEMQYLFWPWILYCASKLCLGRLLLLCCLPRTVLFFEARLHVGWDWHSWIKVPRYLMCIYSYLQAWWYSSSPGVGFCSLPCSLPTSENCLIIWKAPCCFMFPCLCTWFSFSGVPLTHLLSLTGWQILAPSLKTLLKLYLLCDVFFNGIWRNRYLFHHKTVAPLLSNTGHILYCNF